jgi:outer membrane protein assembly factor BamE (lipoprotein component of BamABCDE complex)
LTFNLPRKRVLDSGNGQAHSAKMTSDKKQFSPNRGASKSNFLLSVTYLPALVLLLAGCMSTDTRGVKVEPAQLAQIKIGQTTQAEVMSLLGKPSRLRKSHGQTEMFYRHVQTEHREFAPELLAGKTRSQVEFTTIVIGKDGKVADIKQFTGDTHFSGLLVPDDYPKADLTRVDEIQPGTTMREQVETLVGAPPTMSASLPGNTRQIQQLWFGKKFGNTGQFNQLRVILSHDGIVDEVKQSYSDRPWFPKRVDAARVAQIKERQSNREAAESVLGRPITISRNAQGSFDTYYIKVGGTKEEAYIKYDDNGVITSLMRKQVPK